MNGSALKCVRHASVVSHIPTMQRVGVLFFVSFATAMVSMQWLSCSPYTAGAGRG